MKRVFTFLAVCILAACVLSGCRDGSEVGSGTEKVRLMVWSPSEDQAKERGQWLQKSCEQFAALHPEWDITFVYGVADEPGAAIQVAQDAEASADVFLFANDTLTSMVDVNGLARFGGTYAEEIRSTNTPEVLKSVTLDGDIYGVPFTTNTWYLYYDKSVFTEEDIRNLDTMLEKGVVSFPFLNSWYLPAFYLGNGCNLFGDGTQEEKGADFGGAKAEDVTNYLIDLLANPNFRVDADGSGMAGLRDGSVHAIFSGSWDSGAVKEILGDNMGIAALPTYTLNGQEKQMTAYAGTKVIGVNTNSKDMAPAVALAVYLGSADAQRLHYELRNVVPCNTELLEDPAVAGDMLVSAQNDTFNRTSILQPFVPAMSNCWVPVENMGKAIRNGTVTHQNAGEQTEAMNAAMNSNGI